MQKKLNGAANRAATMELHNQGLSQRKIAMVLNISKTRVAQILKENNSQNGQSGQASQSKELTTILRGIPVLVSILRKWSPKLQSSRSHK